MSTKALQVIELLKSLPLEDQRLVCALLHRQIEGTRKLMRPHFLRTPTGGYYNPDGLANDDPFFKVMEEVEDQRHRTPGRPAPEFD